MSNAHDHHQALHWKEWPADEQFGKASMGKIGMWVFLLSEVMFFTSLIGSYIILRFAHPDHFAQPGVVLNVPLTAFNTFFLICSSWFCLICSLSFQ